MIEYLILSGIVIISILLVLFFSICIGNISERKAQKDFEKRQEKYKEMM